MSFNYTYVSYTDVFKNYTTNVHCDVYFYTILTKTIMGVSVDDLYFALHTLCKLTEHRRLY